MSLAQINFLGCRAHPQRAVQMREMIKNCIGLLGQAEVLPPAPGRGMHIPHVYTSRPTQTAQDHPVPWPWRYAESPRRSNVREPRETIQKPFGSHFEGVSIQQVCGSTQPSQSASITCGVCWHEVDTQLHLEPSPYQLFKLPRPPDTRRSNARND